MVENVLHHAGAPLAWGLLAAMVLSGCSYEEPDLPERARIEGSVLFPSNRRVMSTYCTAGRSHERKCHLAAWDLDGGNVKVYQAPKGHYWMAGRFSPDGREFVFEQHDAVRYTTKLAIMNRATEQWRIVEGSDSYKQDPSYHPDGTKIVFAKFTRTPDNYKSRTHIKLSRADIHSVDLTTGKTRALTDFNFRLAILPYFTGCGDEIVYAAEYPYKFLHDPRNERHRLRYNELYEGNTVHTASETKKNWYPEFAMGNPRDDVIGPFSGSAIPANKGAVIYFRSNFIEVAQSPDAPKTTAIWIRKKGRNSRLLYFKSVTGHGRGSSKFTLSSDERYFLIWSRGSPVGVTNSDEGLWRVGVDALDPLRIHIPWARLAVATRWPENR